MRPKIPLGLSEFRTVREEGYTYIDKTGFIRDCLDDSAQSLLLARPRRFGKTTNLSMLRCFLERSEEPLWHLFEGLAIAGAGESYRRHFQRYPTIALTFKDVKSRTWENCRNAMARVIAEAYREHHYLLDAGDFPPSDAADFRAIVDVQASDDLLWRSLRELSRHLGRHHREKVVILIDEYDTPIHASYAGHYYDQAIEFFRNFLSGGLKDNPHLFKGVFTGVMRLAKDSVLTGLNNLEVYTLLRPEFATWFGFTEPEVQGLLESAGLESFLGQVRSWYNGYLMGGQVIYNPWSVLSFVKSQDHEPRPYWVETSSNDLVRELLVERGLGFSTEMEQLIRGESIEEPISEHVALREADTRLGLLWSLLLFTGYLKVLSQRRDEDTLLCTLAIPNQEVLHLYKTLFREWVEQGLGGSGERQALIRALLDGNAAACARLIEHWMLASVSFHDTARSDPPERFYHGFVLGLLASLSVRYEILSNREAGEGRCDVMLAPRAPGQPGVALEFKVRDRDRGETVEEALDRALAQLRERGYAAALVARGATPVQQLAIVFDGKRVHARRATA